MSLIAFPYYGGKNCQWERISPFFPIHGHYVEPYGGSAAMLLNKPRSQMESYNDLNGDVVNFFRVLRETPDKLLAQLELTPYAREEYDLAKKKPAAKNKIERARQFYVRARQSHSSNVKGDSGWKASVSTDNRSKSVATTWVNSLDGLRDVAARFTGVQIDSRPAAEVIQYFDSPDSFFYLDPPYVLDSRSCPRSGYGEFEMSDADHLELAKILSGIKGKFILSGYSSKLYNDIFSDCHQVILGPKKINSTRGYRTEILWMNFRPTQQLSLFSGGF